MNFIPTTKRSLIGFSLLSAMVLVGCVPTLAQNSPTVADPSGPVIDRNFSNGNASMRLTGCVRDGQKQVVCAVAVRSLAQTNLSVNISLLQHRLVASSGFSYPGYIVVDGAKQNGDQLTYSLGAGQTVNQRLVFPNVPDSVTFVPYLELAGYEFRGIPIGGAAAQTPATQPAQPTASSDAFTATLKNNITIQLKGCVLSEKRVHCTITVLNARTNNILVQFVDYDNARAIDPDGNVLNRYNLIIGDEGCCGRFDLPSGIPTKGQIILNANQNNTNPSTLAVMEFTFKAGDESQKIQWRNIPVGK